MTHLHVIGTYEDTACGAWPEFEDIDTSDNPEEVTCLDCLYGNQEDEEYTDDDYENDLSDADYHEREQAENFNDRYTAWRNEY